MYGVEVRPATEWGASMAIASINPATGELLKSFEPLSDSQSDGKLQRAAEAFPSYRRTGFADRARMMGKAAEILESDKEKFARTRTPEMGRLFRAAAQRRCLWAGSCVSDSAH